MADAQVRRGHAGQNGAGQGDLALDAVAGEGRGQGARGGDAQGVHRLGDDEFAQHGAKGGAAIAIAGIGGAARALELNVAALAGAVDDLAQQQRAPVPKGGREAAELVPGIGLGQGLGPVGQGIACKDLRIGRAGDAQIRRQGRVPGQQRRRADGRGGLPGEKRRGQAGIAVVEGDLHRAGLGHGPEVRRRGHGFQSWFLGPVFRPSFRALFQVRRGRRQIFLVISM